LLALALILCWDASGLDLPFARLAGTPNGFPWRDHAMFELVLHEGPRRLSWVCLIGLVIAIRWPFSVLRRLTRAERVQLALTVMASVVAISLIKTGSSTSCPWDQAEFGGMAHFVSHWHWGARDGGPGKCFPAGHASAAFAYLAGWFVFRRRDPAIARTWLWTALALGLVLGLGQQWRGAHYMSHTLWTAWLCWTIAYVIDSLVIRVFGVTPRQPIQPSSD
jgi:membrane-associated PAP2 superfamily phosphatase